jgi:hypothetical protein
MDPTPRIATCPTCGKPFEPRSRRHVFCTRDCAQYGEADCPACSTHFVRRSINQAYCSKACVERADRQRKAAARPPPPVDPRLGLIAALAARGFSQRGIARHIGVSQQRIAQLVRRGRELGVVPRGGEPDPLDEALEALTRTGKA